jgi:DNA polymerase-3 subunit alpha
MSHADFIHLRIHSAFSLSEGAIKIPGLVELCREHAMPAVAITDSGNLFGAMQFSEACVKDGIQPIIGCLLPLARADQASSLGRILAPDGLPVMAQNEVGYGNLVKLVSKSFLEPEPGEAPHVTWADLEAHAEGLIALTGGPGGPVGRLLGDGQTTAAEATLRRLEGMFPDRLYVEIMRHGLAVEKRIEPALIDMAYKHDLPLVATNDVFFTETSMFEAHEVLLCIADGMTVNNDERRQLSPEHYFKSPSDMRALFSDLPEAVDNTMVIARRCAVRAPAHDPILPAFPVSDGLSEADALRTQAEAGLADRLEGGVYTSDMDPAAREEVAKRYGERLEFELGVIVKMNYPGYFLIVAEFIQWAKGEGIPVGPGRGSGAGSVVAWALTITDLDPLRFGLLFERFLNPERISMPDFDIDFCEDRRDEVIRHVQRKYGREQVAQIITFGSLRARAALRDVGRVLELPYGQVDRICKMVPNNPANPVTLAEAIESEAQLRAARDEDEAVARLLGIALKLEGLYRHASTHAAGVVIGDRPLDDLVPLYRDPRSDMPVTQFAMKDVERAGLVKFDFLGLKTLTVLDRTCRLLSQRGIEVDLATLPLDHGPTFEMLGRGDTVGVFQLEGSGMRDVLTKLKPDCFDDIIALVALYRPGPMDNIPKYIACRHGVEPVEYPHPMLEDTLKETAGVIIYQEQVMEIAQVLSGYTLGQADILRRAMGKKDKVEMAAQRENFVSGAMEKGVAKAKAGKIFDLVDKFAGYGFNKSHAAAYALIAYQTAWFKTNHPVEFYAASMSLELGNTDKLGVYRQALEGDGIELLPPDINHSGATFTVDVGIDGKSAVRYALGAIKNVGAQAMAALAAERVENGLFDSLFDFVGRVDPGVINKRQIENLAQAGAFDAVEPNRRRVFDAAELLMRHANAAVIEKTSNQVNMFGGDAGPAVTLAPDLPEVDEWPRAEKLRRERDAIGFHLSAHPLDDYEAQLERLNVVKIASLSDLLARETPPIIKLAGVVESKQERRSAKGNRFAFVTLSDKTGTVEVTLFAEALSANRERLESGSPLLVSVNVQFEGDGMRVTARHVQSLDDAIGDGATDLKVHLAEGACLARLRAILEDAGKGRGRVSIVIEADGDEIEVALPDGYAISPAVCAEIQEFPGVVNVAQV